MATLATLRLVPRAPLATAVRTHLGYIPFEGRLSKPPTNVVKFTMELARANLQPVTKATYTFDPMTTNSHSLRNFMFFWNTKKVRDPVVRAQRRSSLSP